jgi:sugar-specific transcriptional regulator TrmB
MSFTEQIKKAGLTENEAKIYEALLELGARPAGSLSRRTGLHRRVVYDVTDRLIKKGLVGYIIENGTKIFSASNPKRFLEIIEEEKNQIQNVLPEMMQIFGSAKEKQREDTQFYKGKEGLKSVFEDQLAEGKEILIMGGSPMAYEILEYYFVWFDKKRVKQKIKTKIIFDEKLKEKKLNIPLSEIKYLPAKYSSPLAINIYGDKVAIILWNKENPFVIVIKNRDISEGYRKHFEMMWKMSKLN